MRRVYWLIMVFLPAAYASADGLPPGLTITPVSVKTTYEDTSDGFGNSKQGLEFVLLVKTDGQLGLDERREYSSGNMLELVSHDSNGNDLASKVKLSYHNNDKKPEAQCITIRMDDLPSPGSRWVNLKGYLPVKLLGYRTTSKPVEFDLEPDVAFDVAGMNVTVQKVEGNNLSLKLKADREFPLFEIVFTDTDGNEVSASRRSASWSVTPGKTSMSCTYNLKDPYSKLNMALKYWENVEDRDLPIDIKFPFGAPETRSEEPAAPDKTPDPSTDTTKS